MDEPEFPGGILTLRSGQKAGVIRIRLFSETEHPALCIAAQKALGIADDAACDQDCRVRVGRAAADRLTDALERRAASLAAAGAQAIVIDITGNGGGSNWVEPAARVLTPVALRSPHLAFIKHPHWVKQLRERLEDVNRDIGAGDHSAAVTQAKATLDRALANAGESCDRSGVWSGKPPTCSLLVENLLFASGLWPSAKARELPKGSSRTILFEPANYAYHEGANRLPLSVLVDQRTASAAEYFAAILQDNRAATIAGVPTRGAGCGHTNGGIVATLANSGARLSLPDCVRYRADGTNEVLGITPDVLVPWSAYDSSYQRAAKAKQAIERAFASK